MATLQKKQISVLTMNTMAFAVNFAVWVMFSVIGIKIKAELNLNETVFRSDHASNYLVLKGTLGRDKETLLAQIHNAVTHPERANLRAEWMRGL